MRPIQEIGAELGIQPEELIFYGHYKAKLSKELEQRLQDRPEGKLILVTAVNPTPAGEGKTTVSVGLAMATAGVTPLSVIA